MALRKRPSQERSKLLVDAVLEAAEQLAAEEGLSVSVRAIARRAGVGVGSIYDYFTGRDGVLDGVLTRLTEQNFTRLMAVYDEQDGVEDGFLAVLDEMFALYLAQPRLTRVAIRLAVSVDRLGYVQDERDRFVALMVDRLQQAHPNVSREAAMSTALAVTDMATGVMVASLYRDGLDPVARRAMEEMLRRELGRLVDKA